MAKDDKDKNGDQGTGTANVTEFSKEEVIQAVDQKWIKAISDISKRIETAGSGHVEVYQVGGDLCSVDAEATLRHFLEVTCNIWVQPDHSGHKVPTGPPSAPKGHVPGTGRVFGANQAGPEAKPVNSPATGRRVRPGNDNEV